MIFLEITILALILLLFINLLVLGIKGFMQFSGVDKIFSLIPMIVGLVGISIFIWSI